MSDRRDNSATERLSLAEYRALPGRPAPSSPQRRITAAAFQATASEAEIQQAITDWLTAHHVPHSVTDASRVFGPDGEPRRSKVEEGWPDITGVLPPSGRAFFIECKRATGRFRPGQKPMLARLRAAGALVIIARRPDDVIKEIQSAKRDTGERDDEKGETGYPMQGGTARR